MGARAPWLARRGFGTSLLHVMEALGGVHERVRVSHAAEFALADIVAPVAVGLAMVGPPGLACVAGLPDETFMHEGQITKRPIRALTLSALAPRPQEVLWDIGAGSGSIAVEWCLAGGRAIAVEVRADRAAMVRANASALGVSHLLDVVEGEAPAVLSGLPAPDAVFIGGGANTLLLEQLWSTLAASTRLVANSVTLETDALLTLWHGQKGGELLRIELASAAPLGAMRGWRPSRPIMQWSVTR